MAKKYSLTDDLWTLLQTRSVRDVAKKFGVDRRTVQRWKNQGQEPKQTNERKIVKLASHDRRQIREFATSKREHWQAKPLPVPLMGKRQYATEEVRPTRNSKENRAAWQKEKARSKELGRKFDRFFAKKDKKGKTRYYRAQDAGAVVFDLRRARLSDILNLIKSYRGESRGLVMVHRITKWSERSPKAGVTADWIEKHRGVHMGSRPEFIDTRQFSDDAGILDFITERQRKGALQFIRVTEPRTK